MQQRPSRLDPGEVSRVLAAARRSGMAPLLCEVLADESAPDSVRRGVLIELTRMLSDDR